MVNIVISRAISFSEMQILVFILWFPVETTDKEGRENHRQPSNKTILWQYLLVIHSTICCRFSGCFVRFEYGNFPTTKRTAKKEKLSTFYLMKSCKETFIYCYPCMATYLLLGVYTTLPTLFPHQPTNQPTKERKKDNERRPTRTHSLYNKRERRNENKRTCIRPCIRKTMLLIRHSVPFLWMNLKFLLLLCKIPKKILLIFSSESRISMIRRKVKD